MNWEKRISELNINTLKNERTRSKEFTGSSDAANTGGM